MAENDEELEELGLSGGLTRREIVRLCDDEMNVIA